jgi:transposase
LSELRLGEVNLTLNGAGKMDSVKLKKQPRVVTGGVDTHKDLHVAAVVDDQGRVLDSEFFATTRQGYKQMVA